MSWQRNDWMLLICFLSVSCVWQKKIKDGETAYERKQYAVAIALWEKELQENPSGAANGKKYYLLGDAWMRLLQYKEAEVAFRQAVSKGYGPTALAGQARALKAMEEYNQAIGIYKRLAEQPGKQQEAEREIRICQQAEDRKRKKPEYQVEKVFENSTVSDYAPVLFEDAYLVFTSERRDATGADTYEWTGEKFSDLFVMARTGSDVQKFDAAINTSDNEGAAWFSTNMQRMYFTRCTGEENEDNFCRIFFSDRMDGVWSDPVPMPFQLPGINYGHPTLIENDSVLVFSSDLAEPGGTRDLFYSELLPDGVWTAPDAMPSSINSQGNEVFPTGFRDTLFFSSDFWPGQGGFDIFKTYLRPDGSWTPPQNMGYPVNSGGDEFSYIIDPSARPRPRVLQQGFFVSSRDAAGKDDLFRFARLIVEPEKRDTPVTPSFKRDLFLALRTYEPVYGEVDNPNSGVTGRTFLGNTFIELQAELSLTRKEFRADANGLFITGLSPEESYSLRVSREGYLTESLRFDAREAVFAEGQTSLTINKEVVLEKIFLETEITLQNIYYDFDRWDILEEARPALDRLTTLMTDNPRIRIQLTSHTDCRGETEYNLTLSQKRAQAAVDYLIERGIDTSRLVAVGMGESSLVALCPCDRCTEEQHQANRRTTFMILSR